MLPFFVLYSDALFKIPCSRIRIRLLFLKKKLMLKLLNQLSGGSWHSLFTAYRLDDQVFLTGFRQEKT